MKTKKLNLWPVFVALMVLMFASVHSTVAQGTWTSKAPMPTPRLGLGAASINGIVYAVGGGNNACGAYSTVEAYDPATDSWSTKAPMPTPRYSLAVVAVNGILYAIGGGGNCNNAFDRATVEAYNPTNDSWATKSPMPAAIRNISASVVNGIIYVVGGDNTALHPAYAYNPATDTWTTKILVPPERHAGVVGSIDGIMYWAGGYDGSGYMGPAAAYTPVTDSWTTKASIPTLRHSSGAGIINGKLYVVGGQSPTQVTGAMEVYDPATDSWNAQTSMPTARGPAVAVANGVLYALGGYSGTELANNEAFSPPALTNIVVTPANPVIGIGTNQQFAATGNYSDGLSHVLTNASGTGGWVARAVTPAAKYGTACAEVNGQLYAVSGAGFDSSVFQYNPASNVWSTKAPLPGNYAYAGAAGIGSKFFFMGGCQNADCNTPGSELLIYDTLTDAWTNGASMLLSRSLAGVGVINGKIYVAGGRQSNSGSGELQVQVYDVASNTWTTVQPMPVGRSQCGAAVINGKLYLVGGFDSNPGAPFSSLIIYDPATDSWTTKAPMPTPRYALGATAVGGLLYAIGGTGAAANLVEVYDPVTDSWSTGVPTLTGHFATQPVAINGTIYLAGNGPQNNPTANAESFTPQTLLWSSGSPPVAPINTSGAAAGLTIGIATITAASENVFGNTTLTVVTQPAITGQPMNATVAANGTTTFTAGASGGALAYQWQFNGSNIDGATGASLTLTGILLNQVGCYSVIVNNVAGTTTSACAQLTVLGINMYSGLTIHGSVGANYHVEYVNNLNNTNWQTLTNLTLPVSPYLQIDTDSPNHARRFYRAILVP